MPKNNKNTLSFKDLVIGFMEERPDILEEDGEKVSFYFDNFLTLNVPTETTDSAEKDFLKDIFPNIGPSEKIWGMSEYKDYKDNFKMYSIEEAVSVFTEMSKRNVNLYFSPALFSGWRKDENAESVSSVFVDIDGIGDIDFSKMDEKGVSGYLMENYDLTPETLPNWAVGTGHGLHLYYITETLNLKDEHDCMMRLMYLDPMIAFFGADHMCRNKSRILRFPGSRNVKDPGNIKQTRLFHLNDSEDRSIRRLDFFLKYSPSEIDEYMSKSRAKTADKRKQTMIANGTWKEKADKPQKQGSEKMYKKTLSEYKYTFSEKKETDYKPSHPELKEDYSPLPAKSRYKRILRDMHNWAARRGGVPRGKRDIFTYFTAIYKKKMKVKETAVIDYVAHYVDPDFMEEAKRIIKEVYSGYTEITYKNASISDLLEYTEEDLEKSFSLYNEKEKSSARSRANSEYDGKRYKDAREEKKDIKELRYKYVETHPEISKKELAKELKCSERTVQRIRKELKNK